MTISIPLSQLDKQVLAINETVHIKDYLCSLKFYVMKALDFITYSQLSNVCYNDEEPEFTGSDSGTVVLDSEFKEISKITIIKSKISVVFTVYAAIKENSLYLSYGIKEDNKMIDVEEPKIISDESIIIQQTKMIEDLKTVSSELRKESSDIRLKYEPLISKSLKLAQSVLKDYEAEKRDQEYISD